MPPPTSRLISTWTPVRGLRLHALTSAAAPPDAPTVVLVHGVAVSSRYLVPLAEALAPRARVFVPDLPGYGRSDRPAGRDLTVPELADALLDWLDRVGLDRPHLLGNSFGCQVIADLAARHPDRVDRIVLQGPTFDPGRPVGLEAGAPLAGGPAVRAVLGERWSSCATSGTSARSARST